MHRFQPPFPIDADPGEAGPGATAVDIAVLAGSGGVHAQPAGGRDANDGAVQRAFPALTTLSSQATAMATTNSLLPKE